MLFRGSRWEEVGAPFGEFAVRAVGGLSAIVTFGCEGLGLRLVLRRLKIRSGRGLGGS